MEDNDNNKDYNNYKGSSALGHDRDLGFLRGHQGHQWHQPHDDDDNKVEDNYKDDNNFKDISALRLDRDLGMTTTTTRMTMMTRLSQLWI